MKKDSQNPKVLGMLAQCTIDFDKTVVAPESKRVRREIEMQRLGDQICRGLDAFGQVAGGLFEALAG